MYITFRQMKADPARMQDALALMDHVVGRLNDHHGAAFGYSLQIGGDPSVIALSSPWETLGDYQAMRDTIAADTEIQTAIRLGADLFSDAQDTIGKVLAPAGDRSAFTWIDTARIHLPAVQDALPFCMEAAQFVHAKTGREVGLISAYTGDRSQVAWVMHGSSMDDLESINADIESDEEFMAFYKRSEDLIVAGSAQRSIWQLLG